MLTGRTFSPPPSTERWWQKPAQETGKHFSTCSHQFAAQTKMRASIAHGSPAKPVSNFLQGPFLTLSIKHTSPIATHIVTKGQTQAKHQHRNPPFWFCKSITLPFHVRAPTPAPRCFSSPVRAKGLLTPTMNNELPDVKQ